MPSPPPIPEKPHDLLVQLRKLRGCVGAGRAWRQMGYSTKNRWLVSSGGQHYQWHVSVATLRIDDLARIRVVFLLSRGLSQEPFGIGVEPGNRRLQTWKVVGHAGIDSASLELQSAALQPAAPQLRGAVLSLLDVLIYESPPAPCNARSRSDTVCRMSCGSGLGLLKP